MNCDADEVAAQIIDGGVMASIIFLFGHYCKNRAVRSPKGYYNDMVGNEMGCMDLDGICPYAGEDEHGRLLLPDDDTLWEYYRSKAKTEKWSDEEKVFGGRPWNFMKDAIRSKR